MPVLCVRSFVARKPNGEMFSASEGQKFTLPEGCDEWIRAGFVVKIDESPAETTTVSPASETAAVGKRARK